MSEVIKVNDNPIPPEQLVSYLKKYQMLPQLMRGLVIDHAITPISCPQEAVETAKKQYLTQNQLTDPKQVKAWLQRHHLTQQEFEQIAIRSYKLEQFKQQNWGNKIESYFLQRKNDLDQVVYSLIRTKDKNTATELYFRLENQEASFEELAQHYSQGPEAQTRGIIGPVPVSTPHEDVKKMLLKSEVGQLWPPMQISEWYIIVRLEKLISAQLDDATRQKLLDELFYQWLEQQVQKLITIESLHSETSEVTE